MVAEARSHIQDSAPPALAIIAVRIWLDTAPGVIAPQLAHLRLGTGPGLIVCLCAVLQGQQMLLNWQVLVYAAQHIVTFTTLLLNRVAECNIAI